MKPSWVGEVFPVELPRRVRELAGLETLGQELDYERVGGYEVMQENSGETFEPLDAIDAVRTILEEDEPEMEMVFTILDELEAWVEERR